MCTLPTWPVSYHGIDGCWLTSVLLVLLPTYLLPFSPDYTTTRSPQVIVRRTYLTQYLSIAQYCVHCMVSK
jgi:hypothetical protein